MGSNQTVQAPGTGSGKPKLAVLIDADNETGRVADSLFGAIRAIGNPTIRRIYGDFSNGQIGSWREALSTFSLKPIQRFPSAGKNATDITLVIDAMDLLHSGLVDAFCIVSLDSDFTDLAIRIREEGMAFYGFGRDKAPASYMKACTRFQILPLGGASSGQTPKATKVAKAPNPIPLESPDAAISEAVTELAGPEGWSDLGMVGQRLLSKIQGFKVKRYGHKRLVDLIRSRPDLFEVLKPDKTNRGYRVRTTQVQEREIQEVRDDLAAITAPLSAGAVGNGKAAGATSRRNGAKAAAAESVPLPELA